MRIFVVKGFGRFQQREKITDAMLCNAIRDAGRGLVDARLGVQLIKQRIARPGQGKRGGFRAFRWLGLDDEAIERAIADDELREVFCDEEGKKA
jgi:hypothetical protein